jgi:RIO-like serine/threonine protein kinase
MQTRTLKRDALGTVRLVDDAGTPIVERDTRSAPACLRWLARSLARREAAALAALAGLANVPQLLAFDGTVLRRTFLPGEALHLTRAPRSRRYFAEALRVLRRVHRAGVTHNDLAKEANWIVSPDDTAGVVDFQVAHRATSRTRRFRRLAYEDLRHLLKHKRTYRPEALTALQRRVLAAPGWRARLWRATAKPAYRFVTRKILGWPERQGPTERAF